MGGYTLLQAQEFAVVFSGLIVAIPLGMDRAVKFVGPLVVELLVLGKVARHVIASASGYASTLSRTAAMAISVFGACAFAVCVFTARRTGAQ